MKYNKCCLCATPLKNLLLRLNFEFIADSFLINKTISLCFDFLIFSNSSNSHLLIEYPSIKTPIFSFHSKILTIII